ncbi:hypothetical protein ACF3NS_02645 [Arsenicicoccus cauae]|uniref:Uncharacterized protein n=1 Tax=Arsenicicoccus cauae TaxID=2663847 RepID=A0A6I3ID54_9MICO|nr:hypothetical protein [Arsenicicoccus cauae]MTB70583.1 hypothetical protein [Arsenicicoccus cauae]
MSDSFQPGHEHAESRDAIVTLSTPMLEQLDERQRRILVNDLVELSQSGRDPHAVSEILGERLSKLGIEQPQHVVDRLSENIAQATNLTISLDDGTVLHGDPSWSPATHDTDVKGTEDPENGERPTYS